MGRKKGTRNRTAVQKEHDIQVAVQMYKAGYNFYDIGRELELSHVTVFNDVNIAKQRWRESALADSNEMIHSQLASIDAIESEAWAEWHRSKKDAVKSVSGNSEKGSYGSKTITGQTGDPAYLKTVQWCVEQRLKIFGLYEQPNAGDSGATFNIAFLSAVKEKALAAENEAQNDLIADYPELLDYIEGQVVDDK